MKITQKLRETFAKLEFEKRRHIYSYYGKRLTPATNLINEFYEEFNTQKHATRVAKREGVPVEVVIQRWADKGKRAADFGTSVHDWAEDYANAKFFSSTTTYLQPRNNHEIAAMRYLDNLPNYMQPVALELRMFSKEFDFAGTCDLLFYNHRTQKYIIGDWKGLPLDTPILTLKGWKSMGTVSKGDIIFDKDGKETVIKNVSEIHNKKCLKINFDNSESIVADYEHKWLISFKNGKSRKEEIMSTQQLQDYIKQYSDDFDRIQSYKTLRILNPKPLNNKDKILPIDPYVLGIWLGDGHKACGMVTNMNDDVWIEIKKRGYEVGDDVSQGGAGKAKSCTIFKLHTELRKLNLLFNKHLPEGYLLSSYKQRLDLFRGFMDADGYYNKTRKRFAMSTTRQWQVDAMVQLLGSLGIKSTVLPIIKHCNGKNIASWDVCFTTLLNPFLIRNQDISFKTNNEHTYRRILSVADTEQVPTKCIEVDSPTHTFLVGESMIVTHNTNEDIFKNFNSNLMYPPFHYMLDMPYNHYQLQLSLYQVILEECGYEVEDRVIIWLKSDGNYQTYYTKDFRKLLKEYLHVNRRSHTKSSELVL